MIATQEINSGPNAKGDDRRAVAARSGRRTDMEIAKHEPDSRTDVQHGDVRDDDDEERSPTGTADPARHASEHNGA